MLNYFLKITLRLIRKNRIFFIINLLGLGIGFASFMLIMNYIFFETSYEKGYSDYQDIYRLTFNRYENDELQESSVNLYPGIGKIIKDEVPEIIKSTRIFPEECTYKYENNIVSKQRVYWADDDFIDMFDVKMIHGSQIGALDGSYELVLTRDAAIRIFGTENPVGEKVAHNEGLMFTVTGVCEDLPKNSHFAFDVLCSWQTLNVVMGDAAADNLQYRWTIHMMQALPNIDRENVESKLTEVLRKHATVLTERNIDATLKLQPIRDIHLGSNLSGEITANIDVSRLYYMLAIAVIIILMAWINFINLATAKSMERAKEIGIYKINGASRTQIIGQILFETLLYNVAALIVALIFIRIFFPMISVYTGNFLTTEIWFSVKFWLIVLSIIFGGSLLSGFYPAYMISGYHAGEILHGGLIHTSRGMLTRKALVIIEFSAAIVLIIGTITIQKQLHFMQTQNLGFTKDQVLVIETPRSMINNPDRMNVFRRFKDISKQNPAILEVTVSNMVPGRTFGYRTNDFNVAGANVPGPSTLPCHVESDFFKTLGIEMVAGKPFSQIPRNDSAKVIINETAAMALGYSYPEKAVNQMLAHQTSKTTTQIIGVIKDYHQHSLKDAVEPIIFNHDMNYEFGYYLVKFEAKQIQQVIEETRKIWEEIYPNDAFDYHFLDQMFEEQYNSDKNFSRIWNLFAIIAVFISCMGIGGLSLQDAVNRTKEIGVRKVLGADVINIVFVLAKDFMKLVLISIVISWPIAWFAMNKWLQGFSYRINLSILTFLSSGLIALVVAFIAVSWQTIKAANSNPVDSLKME